MKSIASIRAVFCLCFFLSFSAFAHVSKCPVQSGENVVKRIIAKINKAGNCDKAAELAAACGFGDSKDLHIAGAANKFCKKGLKGMTAADNEMYTILDRKCVEKYANLNGTMYRSFTAFCRLNVTKLFNKFYESIEE